MDLVLAQNEAVLHTYPGVALQTRADLQSRDVAGALLRASSHERRRTTMWTEQRFESLNVRLLEEAR